jgi:hypothetical protein
MDAYRILVLSLGLSAGAASQPPGAARRPAGASPAVLVPFTVAGGLQVAASRPAIPAFNMARSSAMLLSVFLILTLVLVT